MPRGRNKKKGKKKQAEEKAPDLTPKQLGDRDFLNNNFPGAVKHYKACLDQDEKNHKLWSNLSAAYFELSEFDLALEAAEHVIAIDNTWAKGFLRKGKALAGVYRYVEAKTAFEAGLKIDPNDAGLKAGHVDCSQAVEDLKIAESELFQKDNPDAKRMDVLLDWLREGKAIFPKLYMQWYSFDFRGVHALTNIRNGELIMKIPITHIMTCEDAKKSVIGAQIHRCGYELHSDDSYLAAYILEEKAKKDSYWKPYLDCLPQKYENMPIYFGPELLGMLKGSYSLEMRAARIASLKEEYKNICHYVPDFKQFTYDEFVWARLVVITRQFGVTVNGVETDGLVPYADMLNHKLPRETEWTYVKSADAFTITALQSLPRGGQIYDSYGRKCNGRFFVNYGFSIDVNPDNEAVIRLELPRNDPAYNLKTRLLAGFKFSHRRRCQIPANYAHKKTQDMFSFLRFIHAQESELLSISQMETKDGIKIPPLSATNEIKVLTELKLRATAALSLFETSIAEDEKLKDQEEMYSNRRNCIIMRLGEKKVLQFFVDLASRCLPYLNMTWRELKPHAAKVRNAVEGIDLYVAKICIPLVKRR